MTYSTGICVFVRYHFDSLFLLLISVFAQSFVDIFKVHRTLSNYRATVVMTQWHSLGINFKGHSLQLMPGKQGVWRAGHCLGRPQVSLCLSWLYLIKTTAPCTLPVEPFILPRTQHGGVQMAPPNLPSLKVAIKVG